MYEIEQASTSDEELNTGVAVHASGEPNIRILQHPGAYPNSSPEEWGKVPTRAPSQASNPTRKEEEIDPTLLFTTLLIAKPLPFDLGLRVRNRKRAKLVRREYDTKREEGEFVRERSYWGPEQGKGQRFDGGGCKVRN